MAERRRSSAVGPDGQLVLGNMMGMINESLYGLKGAGPNRDLRCAALLGDEQAFDAALAAGATFENADSGFEKTLLALAAESGSLSLVRRLLQAGRPMQRLLDEAKAGQSSHPVRVAIGLNDAAMVGLLLDAGAPEWSSGARDRWHVLHWGVVHGAPDVVRLALDRGADPNVRSEVAGETPIMLPCETHAQEILNMLVAAGADAKLESKEGMTALANALVDQRSHMIPLLIAAGADPLDQVPKWQHSAFAHLIQKNENANALLAMCKACPELRGFGYRRSILFWGLRNKNAEVVRLAVEAGADLKDTYGGKTVWQVLGKSKAAEPILRELRATKTQRRIEDAFEDDAPTSPKPRKGSGGPSPL